jgi:hypothetical protein
MVAQTPRYAIIETPSPLCAEFFRRKWMEKPLDGFNLPEKIGERIIDKPELPPQGLLTDSTVFTEIVVGEGQLKRGTIGKFEVFSDEAARIGGSDKYASPMSYMAMGVGF